MGYYTFNIITTSDTEQDPQLLEDLTSAFKGTIKAKTFETTVKGVIGQIDILKLEDAQYNNLSEENDLCPNIDDIIFELPDQVVQFSLLYPNKKIAFIEVECFGGVCLYEGFIVQNGIKLKEESSSDRAHIALLKEIYSKYGNEIYFEPFTRDFF